MPAPSIIEKDKLPELVVVEKVPRASKIYSWTELPDRIEYASVTMTEYFKFETLEVKTSIPNVLAFCVLAIDPY